jgi:hypothetical protein
MSMKSNFLRPTQLGGGVVAVKVSDPGLSLQIDRQTKYDPLFPYLCTDLVSTLRYAASC